MAATTRVSEIDGDRAEWTIVDSVVRVQLVRRADGTETTFQPPLELGQALTEMPRRLWDEVQFRYGLIRRSGAHGADGDRS
ncbi:hypothetical protein [Nocardia salmonicida]|uniref:hypothetical protein n=1 Tax=Nocardia salmonicida TaxID=53431 RepID=UPI0012F4F83A|nr:hypothetical protein [Nocardia salmonicida]